MRFANYFLSKIVLTYWKNLGLIESKTNYKICTFLDNEKFADRIPSNVTMVITKAELANSILKRGIGVVLVDEPRKFFFTLHNALADMRGYCRDKFATKIDTSAQISKYADIAEHNVIIGKNVVIESFVTIYENTVIEDNAILRSGCKIGGCGFEFKRDGNRIMPVTHLGGTYIEHDVEVQNNSCIDRAVYPWDDTKIGSFSKIDNLVHVGHAAKVGANVMIVANSGIGGRTEIGNDTWIGFGATLRNGIVVGKNARANMGAVVTKSVKDNESVTGNFAIEHKQFVENIKKITNPNT